MRSVVGSFEQSLNGLSARWTDEIVNLMHNLVFRCGAVEHQGRDGDHNEQQRRDREERIKCQCGTQPLSVVPGPRAKALAQQDPDIAPAKQLERFAVSPRSTRWGGQFRTHWLKNAAASKCH